MNYSGNYSPWPRLFFFFPFFFKCNPLRWEVPPDDNDDDDAAVASDDDSDHDYHDEYA